MKTTGKGSYEKKELMAKLRGLAEEITSLLGFLVDFDNSYNAGTFVLNEQYRKEVKRSISGWVTQKEKGKQKLMVTDVEFLETFKDILVDAEEIYEKNSEEHKKHVAIDFDNEIAEKLRVFFENWKPHNETDLYLLKKIIEVKSTLFLLDLTFAIVKSERSKALARLGQDKTSQERSVDRDRVNALEYSILQRVYSEYTHSEDFFSMPIEWIVGMIDFK